MTASDNNFTYQSGAASLFHGHRDAEKIRADMGILSNVLD